MLSQAELEDLRDTLGALVELGDNGPFSPETRTNIAAVQNALCYVLQDNSSHASTFERNYKRLLEYCRDRDIRIIRLRPATTFKQ